MKPETAKALQELAKSAAKSLGYEGEDLIISVCNRTEEVPEIQEPDPCPGFAHDWKEEYYGHRCTKCDLFYAHGQAPWDDEGDEYADEYDY